MPRYSIPVVEGLRFGSYVVVDTEAEPVEGDELLIVRDGRWAVVPWEVGEPEGRVIHAWCREDPAAYTSTVAADPHGAKYITGGRLDLEKSRSESATDTDSTQ